MGAEGVSHGDASASTRIARSDEVVGERFPSERRGASRGSVAEGGVEAPCARVEGDDATGDRRRRRSNRGVETRPWKPLACARSIVWGVSRSTPGTPGDEAETPWSWTSRTTLSLVGTRTMRMARSGGGAENLSDAVSATARRCGRGGARSRRSRELDDATTTSRDGSRTGVQKPACAGRGHHQTGDLRHFGALCKRDSLPVGSRRERRCERHSGRAR